ncbi:MAG: cyclic nucleotide-binding domain-containing protein [Rhodanobacteraceae bacterium]|nr:cyclic nucleotide-binding domain-containing protein [Rhodanobacteraceae bacterium]
MTKATEHYVDVPAGQYLFREGDAGTEMYIVESGSMAILRNARGSEPIALLEAGDFLGEMAVLEDQPRFASALARTDCRLLRIERAAFAELLRQNVEIAVRIMRKLSLRQRRTEQRVSELHQELQRLRDAARQAVEPSAAVPVPVSPAPAPASVAPVAAKPAAASTPAAVMASTLALQHLASGQRFALEAGRDEFLVGRVDPVTGITPEINLGPLDVARSLSRRHAKLLRQGTELFLREEVGTANGTFVNGQRIATGAAVAIKPGDRLRFGTIDIELVTS